MPASQAPSLKLRLLGPPEVLWEGMPLTIQRRKLRALLFYLGAEEEAVPRDRLATLLWGEGNLRAARRRLSEALTRLQQQLPLKCVHRQHDLLSLDPEAVWVDVRAFRACVVQADRLCSALPNESPLPGAAVQALREALSLWHGSAFLQGFSAGRQGEGFDEWVSQTDETLQQLRRQALHRLTQHALATGDWDEALRWGQQLLEMDPAEDRIARRLIQALVQKGQRARAQALWSQWQQRMREYYGVDYDERVRKQVEALLRTGSSPSPQAALPWHPHTSLRVPYVGRRKLLRELVIHAHQGGGAVLLGEAGQGKTRTLQEIAKQLRNTFWVWGLTCHEREQHLPFQPWVAVLQEQIDNSIWELVSPHQAAYLLPLAPELRWRFPDLKEPPFFPEKTHALILQALHHLVQQAATRRPVMICVDDAQWVDQATWETLCYLLQREPFTNGRAFLLITMRSEEIPPDLESHLETLHSQERIRPYTLEPLSLEEVRQLATFVLNRTVSTDEVRALYRESGGNPLYSLEMLRWALQQMHRQEGPLPQGYPLPESLQALIRHRLENLPEEAIQVLEAAAVIGHDITIDLLQQLIPSIQHRIPPTLQLLTQHRFLVRQDHHDVYQFVHDKVREAVLQRLAPGEAQRLHYHVAQALAERAHPTTAHTRAPRIAYHYQQAHRWREAFRWWYRAMRHAIGLGALADARRAFQQANALAEAHAEALHEEDLWALYREHQILAAQINDAEGLEHASRSLQRLSRQRNSGGLRGLALQGLAEVAFIRNEWQVTQHYLREALPLLQTYGQTVDRMRALTRLGVVLYMTGYPLEGATRLQEALALAEQGVNDELYLRAQADAYYELTVCATYTADLSIALHYAQRAIDLYLEANFPFGEMGARSIRALVRYYLGEYHAGLQDARNAHRPLETLGKWRLLAYNHIYQGLLLMELGQLGSAWEHAQRVLSLAQAAGHPEVRGGALRIQGDIWLALNRPDLALPLYEQGAREGGETFGGLDNIHRLAHCLGKLGQVQEGVQHIRHLLAELEPRGAWVIALPARLSLARIYLDAQNPTAALEVLQSTTPELRRRNMQTHYGLALCLQGEALWQRGDAQEAQRHWRQALTISRRTGNVWLGFYALQNLAQSGPLPPADISRGRALLNWLTRHQQGLPDPAPFQRFVQQQQRWLKA